MSKERLKEVDRWLLSMKDILSSKTEEKEIEEVQQRIDLFEWLREQAFAVHGGETFTGYKEQNKRYRDLLKEIKSDIKTDYTDSEIENMPLLNVIIEQINKALEGEE